MSRPVVSIESPFSGQVNRNLRYLAWCVFDSFMLRGETPIASHALLPLAIPEDESGRALGKEYHTELLALGRPVLYVDLGISSGMRWAGDCEQRRLPEKIFALFEHGSWPPGSTVLLNKSAASTGTPPNDVTWPEAVRRAG